MKGRKEVAEPTSRAGSVGPTEAIRDDVLRGSCVLPRVFQSVQFDPCLDDCVMFARKLKRLGNKTTLDVLEGLPHGFLNFSMLSKEAHNGSNLCVRRIKELLLADSQPHSADNLLQ